LESSAKSVELAIVSVDLAQKTYEAEDLKYKLGTSIMFYVLDAAQQLTAAKSALTAQYISYHRNRLTLLRETGELLRERNIVIQ
jgi:outer membrane protein TolC